MSALELAKASSGGTGWQAVAVVIGAAGLVVAIVSAVIAGKALQVSRRSTDDVGRSADAAERSAAAAHRSANAEEASAKAGKDLARIEGDRSHDLMAPEISHRFEWERNPRTDRNILFCYLISGSPRDYQVNGWLINAAG